MRRHRPHHLPGHSRPCSFGACPGYTHAIGSGGRRILPFSGGRRANVATDPSVRLQPPVGRQSAPSLEVNNLDLRLPSDPHRVWREEVGPNPVMMVDDLVRTEMRSVAHRVAVGDRDDSKAQRSG